MVDLSVEITGLKLASPVLPAAGPPGWNGAAMAACARGGAAAIVSKTISVCPAKVPTPNMAALRYGFLNTELWSELPVEQFVEHELPQAKGAGVPLIVSLGYTADDIARLAPLVAPFADALELSTHYIGDDAAPLQEAVQAAKAAAGLPVWVKLSPFRDMRAAATAAAAAGADAIVAVNSFGPCLGVDAESAQLLMGSRDGYGWLSGPALKPLALRCVFDIVRTVDLPVIGVGGISSGVDAIEFLMVGATAVGVCTAAILAGPTVFGRLVREIGEWLDLHGYVSLDEVRGLAIRNWQARPFRTRHVPPHVDWGACTGCGQCEKSCVYDAVHVTDKKAAVQIEKCYGCGLCVTRCPVRALSLPWL